MAISIDEVDKIASLARLSFSDDEKQKFTSELSSILNYIDQLKEVDPSAHSQAADSDAENLMRDDVPESLASPKDLLAQAPDTEGNFVKVKSILE